MDVGPDDQLEMAREILAELKVALAWLAAWPDQAKAAADDLDRTKHGLAVFWKREALARHAEPGPVPFTGSMRRALGAPFAATDPPPDAAECARVLGAVEVVLTDFIVSRPFYRPLEPAYHELAALIEQFHPPCTAAMRCTLTRLVHDLVDVKRHEAARALVAALGVRDPDLSERLAHRASRPNLAEVARLARQWQDPDEVRTHRVQNAVQGWIWGVQLPHARQALEHRDPGVRLAAALKLYLEGDQSADALQHLLAAVRDADREVRLVAVLALAEFPAHHPAIDPELDAASRDHDREFARTARNLLIKRMRGD